MQNIQLHYDSRFLQFQITEMAYSQKNPNSTFYQSYQNPYSLDHYGIGCGLRRRPPSSETYSASNKRNRNQCCQGSHVNFHRQCTCSVKLQPLCECDCYMLPSLYHKLLSAPYTTLAKTPKEKKPPKKEVQNKIVYIQRPTYTPPPQPTFIRRIPPPQNVTFNMQPQNIGRTLVNYLIPSHQVINNQSVALQKPTTQIQKPIVSFNSIPMDYKYSASPLMERPSQNNVQRTSILKPVLPNHLIVSPPSHSTVLNQPISSSIYSIRQTSSVQENPNANSRNNYTKLEETQPKLQVAIQQSKPDHKKDSLSLSNQSSEVGFFVNQNKMGMRAQSICNNIQMSHSQKTQQISYSSSVSRSEVKQIVQKSQKVEQNIMEQDNKIKHLKDMSSMSMNMPAIEEEFN